LQVILEFNNDNCFLDFENLLPSRPVYVCMIYMHVCMICIYMYDIYKQDFFAYMYDLHIDVWYICVIYISYRFMYIWFIWIYIYVWFICIHEITSRIHVAYICHIYLCHIHMCTQIYITYIYFTYICVCKFNHFAYSCRIYMSHIYICMIYIYICHIYIYIYIYVTYIYIYIYICHTCIYVWFSWIYTITSHVGCETRTILAKTDRVPWIDWFWLQGWLNTKGPICTGTAPLFWNFISLFERPRTRRKSKSVYCRSFSAKKLLIIGLFCRK